MHTDKLILDQLHVILAFKMYEHIHKQTEIHTHPPTHSGQWNYLFLQLIFTVIIKGASVWFFFHACSRDINVFLSGHNKIIKYIFSKNYCLKIEYIKYIPVYTYCIDMHPIYLYYIYALWHAYTLSLCLFTHVVSLSVTHYVFPSRFVSTW